jgi:hypothetical protein
VDNRPSPETSRLSLPECRRLLGREATDLSDAKIEGLRDQLYTFAQAVRAQVSGNVHALQRRVVASQRDPVDVEERAAIMEFDGGLPRALADRLACAGADED